MGFLIFLTLIAIGLFLTLALAALLSVARVEKMIVLYCPLAF